ncbi:MAG: SulP family inorganic anion transporter [Parvularculaceae bacterium]|nr:SulP family inorganic anion transporter [Parvularculaceae bacterium]
MQNSSAAIAGSKDHKRAVLLSLFPFLRWTRFINQRSLRADFLAGLTGAVIALPQAIAFAAIAGLPPEFGLYTAMVTPVIAALFGSSRHLVSGPTTAISIVVFAAVSDHATPGTPEFIRIALTLTLLAGVYQFLFGIFRLGRITNFVSHNVVVGFTTGAAILIAVSQVKHVLGVSIPAGESFIHTIADLWAELPSVNPYSLVIAAVTLATAIIIRMLSKRAPHLLIAMIAGGIVAFAINAGDHGVAMVTQIPAQLPPLSHPDFSFSTIAALAPGALAIALLGLVEAVSISRSIAARSHQQIDSDQEFIGQGLSNMIGGFFSSYAGSGSFTRSAANYDAGAVTPLSAIFSAIILGLIVLFAAPLTAYLPVPAMGAVILLVAYNLIQPGYIRKVVRISKRETSVLLVTFLATLFLDLEFAIFGGVMLSLSLFLMRTSTPEIVALAPDFSAPKRRLGDVRLTHLTECPQIKIIRIDMSIYFGSLDFIQKEIVRINEREGYKHILILGAGVNFIDMAGAEMLVRLAERLRALGGGLYFCSIKPSVCDYLIKSGFGAEFGSDNLFLKKSEAIDEIIKRINYAICEQCSARIFIECEKLPGEKAQPRLRPWVE